MPHEGIWCDGSEYSCVPHEGIWCDGSKYGCVLRASGVMGEAVVVCLMRAAGIWCNGSKCVCVSAEGIWYLVLWGSCRRIHLVGSVSRKPE